MSKCCYFIIDYGSHQTSCCTDGATVDSGSFGEIKNCLDNTNKDINNLILKTNKSKTPFTRELSFIDKTQRIANPSSYAKMYKVKNQNDNSEHIQHIIAMEKMDKVLDKLLYSDISISNVNLCANKLIKTVKSFHRETQFSHNDIKPSNIGATSDVNTIKLIDLGSTIHSEEDANKDDSAVGTTILYRPCVDLEKYDHEFNKCADLWAVGCVLFEIVAISNNPKATNHYLFDMTGINPMMLLNLIELDDLKYILGVNPYNQCETPKTPLYNHRLAKYKEYLNEKKKLFNRHSFGTRILNLMKPVLVLEKKHKMNDRVGSSNANANMNVNALYNIAVPNNSNTCTDNDNINIAKTTRPKNTTESRYGETSINKQVDTVIRSLIKDLADTSTTGGNKKAKSKRPMTLEERRKYEQKMRIDANIMNAVAGEFRRNHKIQQLLHSSENVRKPNQKSKTLKSPEKQKKI
jgi:serine/threonine protein kinase